MHLPASFALWCAASLPLIQPPASAAPNQEVGNAVELDGADCLACNADIDGPGREVVHRGRVLHLHEGECAAHWAEDAPALFAKAQPKAALWDETFERPSALANGWLWLGGYVLAGLVFGALSGYVAIDRRRPALLWFFLGFAFNLLGFLLLLSRPREAREALEPALEGVPAGLRKVPLTHSPGHCPKCGAEHHPSASRCRCGASLTATVEAETVRAAGAQGAGQ